MTEDRFVREREPAWQAYEQQLGRLRHRKSMDPEAAGFPMQYRSLCQDLNQARAKHYSLNLIERLNHLVWEGHQILYRPVETDRLRLLRAVLLDFPARVRQEYRAILLGHLLFYGLGLVVFLYVLSQPAMLDLFIPPESQYELREMYDPANEHFLKPREVSSSADMFGYYINNNIGIGLRTFAGGALAGLGSILILAYNAVFLGAVAAMIVDAGFGSSFFPFVVTHSAFELSAIVLFAVAGLRIGWALVAPGRLARGAAFRQASQSMLPLIAGSFFFLVIAAGIEAFWSSLVLPAYYKYLSGAFTWSLVLLFLLLGGSRRA